MASRASTSRPPSSRPTDLLDPGVPWSEETSTGSIRWKKWFPLLASWPALTTIYLLWLALLVGTSLASPKPSSIWNLLREITSPLTHLGAFALVAPLPWLIRRNRSAFLNFLQGLFLSLVICELTAILLVLLDAFFLRRDGLAHDLGKTISIYCSLVGPGMMIVGGLTAARARSDEEREVARKESLVARTRLLQSQVHPHVLFNALNGLAELIHKDPPAAERSVMHLADLMRRIMRASDRPTFPLSEERAVVEDFLALEALRLGSRLKVGWDWDFSLDHLELPPLLLQPLVENAIKHGISPSLAGGELVIRLQAEGRDVRMEVWNTGNPYQPERVGGIGIRNLASRLALTCGNGATFKLESRNGGTLASIHLPGALLRFAHERPANGGGRRRAPGPGAA